VDAAATLTRLLVLPTAAAASVAGFHSSVEPLSAHVQSELRSTVWSPGCPVPLSALRVLRVRYHGFDGRTHPGSLVVNQAAAGPLATAFRRLYALRFPIHHLSVAATYGPAPAADGDISGSFDCRQAVPSPCVGGKGTGTWSEHAYGEAVDLNPVENPYVGCGQTRDPASRPYFNRSRHLRGMVTPAVVGVFRSIGWGWGGSWAGSTHDYMHFSATGH
jgi:hypothetical protein